MHRTQIYLTEDEKVALAAMVSQTGKSQSELIRAAIDNYLINESQKCSNFKAAAGLWKDRDDLPDFEELRREADRW